MTEITGAIDWFREPNSFFGWAQSESDGTPDTVEIKAVLNGTIIGTCIADTERPGSATAKSFNLKIAEKFSPQDILNGSLVFIASTQGKENLKLPIYQRLRSELIATSVSKTLEDATDEEFIRILDLATAKAQKGPKSSIKNAIKLAATDTNAQNSLLGETSEPELSPFNILLGTLSTNKAVTVGRNGHLFLVGGSNDLINQFNTSPEDPKIDRTTSEWKNLISTRNQRLKEKGIDFLQIIIPEKISVLNEMFPLNVNTPTPYLTKMNNKIDEDKNISPFVFSAYETLVNSPERTETYRKLDSHMTAKGNQIIFQEILKKIGISEKIDFPLTRRFFHAGDMSMHFPGLRIGAYDELPDTEDFKSREEKLELIETYFPPDGSHMGRRRVWKNDSASIPLKVVAFGNSFFEMGTLAVCLSWWFARWFKEFHFLWEADLDYDYVDRVKPDLVVCQTIERFLVRVPNA